MKIGTRMHRSASLQLPTLVALALFAGPPAVAQDSGWYIGAGVGQSRAKIADDRIAAGLLGSGLVVRSITDDDRDTGYKLYGGYRFNRYLSAEGGWFDLGKFGFSADTTPTGTLTGSSRIRGINLDVVGTLPLTERLAAFARAGVNHAEAKDAFGGTGAVTVLNPNPSKRDTNYKFGVGLQYALTDALSMRAEAERYRVDDAVGNRGDIDLFSVGLVYRFGARTQAPVARVAPLPPAPPVAVAQAAPPPPPPPPRTPTRATFSADSLFDFDRATIKPAATTSLDRLVAEIRSVELDRVTVTGHTDRLGPQAHNLKLSTRRAEAVKAYLVQAGIPAARITTEGVNGASPVTRPEQCPGRKASPGLIACLQPDRRVEVEVLATR